MKNPHRISLAQRIADYGYTTLIDYLEAECSDSVVDALCDEGCRVEPDGRCSHGCPSPLIAAHLI